MQPWRQISYADLLQTMRNVASEELTRAAESLGFEWNPATSTSEGSAGNPQGSTMGAGQAGDGMENPPPQSSEGDSDPLPPGADELKGDGRANPEGSEDQKIRFEFQKKPRLLKLWQARRTETLNAPLPEPVAGNPATDETLNRFDTDRALSRTALCPWRKMGTFLQHRTGRLISSSVVDIERLVNQASTREAVSRIPYVSRRGWPERVVVLFDRAEEMLLFRPDAASLVQRLRAEANPLRILCYSASVDRVPPLPAETSVILLSALGLLVRDPTVQRAWQRLAEQLQNRGHKLTALCPCPQEILAADVATAWNAVAWDVGQRLPRHIRRLPLTPTVDNAFEHARHAAEILLDLLATSARIDQELLRAVRVLLNQSHPHANALAEWLTWHHKDCWKTIDCIGLLPGEPYHRRLQNRYSLLRTDPELVRQAQHLIDQQHSAYSCALQLETGLRSWSQQSPTSRQDYLTLLQQIVDRLRLLALEPKSEEGRRSGLPRWFHQMIERLPPEVCRQPEFQKLIATGLALTDTWQQTERKLPEGVDDSVYQQQLQLAEQRIDSGQVLELGVGLEGTELVLRSLPAVPRAWRKRGHLRAVAGQHVTISLGRESQELLRSEVQAVRSEVHSRVIDAGVPERLSLPNDISSIVLETPAARLKLRKVPRPAWAQRFWQDSWGLAAEFRIGNVPFVLRWIPPGRFLMGSPKDENARYRDEGPQHEVTISQGYWLGQTPVTQQQWAAVVHSTVKSDLKPEPSNFAGKPDHPVESVTWHHCVAFCQLVQGQLGDDLTFRLPSEAEWEYACRAGTTGAYHDGSACTEPTGRDPALDRLGWFSKNSGGSTQPVGLKACNNWGLYDMHGNVWEWCRDTRQDYTAEASVDPLGPDSSGASRVLRGGGWRNVAGDCRAASRDSSVPSSGWYSLGLRLSAGPGGFSGGAGDL